MCNSLDARLRWRIKQICKDLITDLFCVGDFFAQCFLLVLFVAVINIIYMN